MKIGANEFLSRLENVRNTGNGYSALCPSHEDQKNSLSVKLTEDKILLKCFAGCSYQEIVSALKLSSDIKTELKATIEAIYEYTDELGKLLYQNVRFPSKEFRQRRYDDQGQEIWNLNGVRRVPFKLSELLDLPENYAFLMAEGEKDVETLAKHGLIATNHKNWKPEFNYLLKGRDVVIFQDHDKSGVEQAKKVLELILPDAKQVKIVDCYANEPLAEKHGKDVSDYLEIRSKDNLLQLIRETPFCYSQKPSAETPKDFGFKVVKLKDVETKEIVWLWKPYIAIGEFTILEGIEGLGKSWLTCALACAVAGGKRLPFAENEAVESSNVLMLSAEDSLSHTVKPRLVSMNADTEKILAIDGVFSIQNSNDLIKFEAVIAEYKPKLVILDPMFSYTGGRDLNSESDSRPIAQKLIAIAQKYECAIVGVRHIGKSKGNGDARNAGLGSIAWRASARSVLLVGKDEETGERAICQTKSNLAEEAKFSVGFEIVDGKFLWKGEPSQLTKEKMLAQPKDEDSRAEQIEAVDFLRAALQDGERPSKEIEKEARELGITNYAFRKAKNQLKVKSEKKGGSFGGENIWVLKLPRSDTQTKGVGIREVRHLPQSLSNKTSYHNGLTEDVEPFLDQQLQDDKTTSSKVKITCGCGGEGFEDERCNNCGLIIIPL